jgi:hypothetical protein
MSRQVPQGSKKNGGPDRGRFGSDAIRERQKAPGWASQNTVNLRGFGAPGAPRGRNSTVHRRKQPIFPGKTEQICAESL